MVRKSAPWMQQLDDRILEHARREGWTSPNVMASHRTFPDYDGVLSDRCKRLHYAGFLEPIYGQTYDLTTEGHLYLDGDIDARHQPIPTAPAVFKRWSFPGNSTSHV